MEPSVTVLGSATPAYDFHVGRARPDGPIAAGARTGETRCAVDRLKISDEDARTVEGEGLDAM